MVLTTAELAVTSLAEIPVDTSRILVNDAVDLQTFISVIKTLTGIHTLLMELDDIPTTTIFDIFHRLGTEKLRHRITKIHLIFASEAKLNEFCWLLRSKRRVLRQVKTLTLTPSPSLTRTLRPSLDWYTKFHLVSVPALAELRLNNIDLDVFAIHNLQKIISESTYLQIL